MSIAETVNEAAGDKVAEVAVKGIAGFIHRHRYVAAALIVMALFGVLDLAVRLTMDAREEAARTRSNVAVQHEQIQEAASNMAGMSAEVTSINSHLNNVDTHLNNIDSSRTEDHKLLTKISENVEGLKQQIANNGEPTAAARIP